MGNILTKLGFDPEDINKAYCIDGRMELHFNTLFLLPWNFKHVPVFTFLWCRLEKNNKYFWIVSNVLHGHLEVMKWLFNRGGAQGDIQNPDRSNSPLRIALELGHFEVVKWLILNGSFSTPVIMVSLIIWL